MTCNEVILKFAQLEELALQDMSGPPHDNSQDPAHLVYCHSRFILQMLKRPREEWFWSVFRSSWRAISSRRILPFVEKWLERNEGEVLEFFTRNSPKPAIPRPSFVDRSGRLHVVNQTA